MAEVFHSLIDSLYYFPFFILLSLSLALSPSLFRSTILQQQFNRVGRVEHGSVALPGIIRSGSIGGPDTFNMGTMPSAQQQITTGQMHRGHMPPLVSVPTSRCFNVKRQEPGRGGK